MITKNTFYTGEYYIPQAKPSISDEAIGADNHFQSLLDRFEEECLIKLLGNTLYLELMANVDLNEDTLISDGADVKWGRLMNGHTYTRAGELKARVWRGLRYKSPILAADYNASLLVPYVYFHYHRTQFTTTTTTGEKKIQSANAENVVPTPKLVNAWNNFVDQAVGKNVNHSYVTNHGLIGVDYYKGDNNISLYEYLRDMNKSAIVYEDHAPTYLERINSFGL
jgi:hypothetical protein